MSDAQDTTRRTNVSISPAIHDAISRHRARQIAEHGPYGVPTLREYVDATLLARLQAEAPDLVSDLV